MKFSGSPVTYIFASATEEKLVSELLTERHVSQIYLSPTIFDLIKCRRRSEMFLSFCAYYFLNYHYFTLMQTQTISVRTLCDPTDAGNVSVKLRVQLKYDSSL
jgi:hypothetical protein